MNDKVKFLDSEGLGILVKNIKDYYKDVVRYKEFTYTNAENETSTRKTIQLDNYDTISGVDTEGHGHNLVMLSKWNVADFGASGVHLNLNSKDSITINDDKHVATEEDMLGFIGSDGNYVSGSVEALVLKLLDEGEYQTVEQVQEIAKAEVDKIVGEDVPKAYDTLKKIATWIESHKGDTVDGLLAEINKKANANEVYTIEQADAKFLTSEDALTEEEVNNIFDSVD